MLLSGQDDNAGQKTGQFQLKRAMEKPQPRAEKKSCFILLYSATFERGLRGGPAHNCTAHVPIGKKSVLFCPKVSHLGKQAGLFWDVPYGVVFMYGNWREAGMERGNCQ